MRKALYSMIGILLIFLLCSVSLSNFVCAADIEKGQGALNVTFNCDSSSVDGAGCYLKTTGDGFVAQATGYTQLSGKIQRSRTTTITLSNEKSYPVIVRFSATYKLGGDTMVASFSHAGKTQLEIAANGSVDVTIKGFGANTSTVDFTITDIVNNTSYAVTCGTSSNCSYTASDSDEEVAAGGTMAAVSAANGMTIQVDITATSAKGYTCVGFADANGNYVAGVDTAGTATFKPTSTSTIYPILVETAKLPAVAPFQIGTTRYFYTWESAFAAASNTDTVALALETYTLPTTLVDYAEPSNIQRTYTIKTTSGIEYIIPIGKTFLVPFDSGVTLYTEAPVYVGSYTKPTAFRTLTLAENTTLIVNGAMSVSGQHCYAHGGVGVDCTPSGPLGMVEMEASSAITVNGVLYAWGYIYGSGSVAVGSAGTVYELLQLLDFRGGTVTKDLTNGTNGVFPFSQYYVQNIEVPMTYYYGAKEYALVTVSATSEMSRTVNFLGTKESLFTLSGGTATKYYDSTNDRVVVELDGNASIENIKIDFGILASVIGLDSIDSGDFVLPLCNNFTIKINSGEATVNQDLALMPGCELNIAEGGKVVLGSGKSMYIYDADQWGNYVHAGSSQDTTHMPIKYSPTKTYTRTTADLKDVKVLVNGELDASAGYLYTTSSGANICSTGTGTVKMGAVSSGVTYQYTQSDTTFHNISVVSAMLKNGDGSYVNSTEKTYNYCADCMAWECEVSTGHISHATNVELGNSLNMYFAFWDTANPNRAWDNYYVEITHTDSSGNVVKSTTLSKKENQWLTAIVNGVTAHVVYYDGLAAKQMGDIITVKLYVNGESEPIDTWSNSIRNYALCMLTDHSDNTNLRTLLVDMLNYGAACQTHFSYNTTNLANASLSAEQKSWATSTVVWSETMPSGNANYYANLVTTGNIQFAIKPTTGTISTSNYTFRNHWNTKDVTGTLLYNEKEDYYYISKLYVADAKQEITITVNGTEWKDSIEAYCKRMIDNSKDTYGVFTAFMKFSNSAKKYLEEGVRV